MWVFKPFLNTSLPLIRIKNSPLFPHFGNLSSTTVVFLLCLNTEVTPYIKQDALRKTKTCHSLALHVSCKRHIKVHGFLTHTVPPTVTSKKQKRGHQYSANTKISKCQARKQFLGKCADQRSLVIQPQFKNALSEDNFQLSVESNSGLLWRCQTELCDWLAKFAPVSPPMRNKNKTNRASFSRFFPRLTPVTCICFHAVLWARLFESRLTLIHD